MEWTIQDLGAIGEFVGAIAVVATLFYVAVQVRHSRESVDTNSELLRSESRQTLVANDVSSLTANLENADVFAKLVSDGELSAEDQLRLSFMFALDLRNREFEYLQYSNGLLDEETWMAYRNVVLINHSTGLGRTWWDEIGRGFVDPGFAKSVDELLVNAKTDETYKRMASLASN